MVPNMSSISRGMHTSGIHHIAIQTVCRIFKTNEYKQYLYQNTTCLSCYTHKWQAAFLHSYWNNPHFLPFMSVHKRNIVHPNYNTKKKKELDLIYTYWSLNEIQHSGLPVHGTRSHGLDSKVNFPVFTIGSKKLWLFLHKPNVLIWVMSKTTQALSSLLAAQTAACSFSLPKVPEMFFFYAIFSMGEYSQAVLL